MVLDLVVEKSVDGYSADVPSLSGCEAWAHTEDEVLDKITEMVMYFLNIKQRKQIKLDLARKEDNNIIYKIIIPNKY